MNYLSTLLLVLVVNVSYAQTDTTQQALATSKPETPAVNPNYDKVLGHMAAESNPGGVQINPNYDKVLAEKLRADDYGMKSYFLVILKTGTNTTASKDLITKSFRGHMDNINKLVKEEKLCVAGPLGKNDKAYRGIFILHNIADIDAAKAILQTDPAIQTGLLDFDIYNWYGSAALPEYLPASDKIWKVNP